MLGLVVWLAGCSTPYRPPVVVHDSDSFPGINRLIHENNQRPLDVLLVHGMCTHDIDWAHKAIDRIAKKIDPHYVRPQASPEAPAAARQIHVVTQTSQLAGATVRLTALVWSPLTADLKQQLAYDNTGSYTDCSAPGNTEDNCKPRRSRFNGLLKDGLLNDCLADAMIYGGSSYETIRGEMVNTLERVLGASSNDQAETLVFISESLGSKILYDALNYMLSLEPDSKSHRAAAGAVSQLGVIFMGANQLPMLNLARENALAGKALIGTSQQEDSLARLLGLRRQQPGPKAIRRLAVVAMTDPNDLLSYRLRRSQYASVDVAVANVLVSNRQTWLGLIEEPYGAHTSYLDNPDVEQLIMTGWESETSARSQP
jgi:hypothetical protein